MSWVSSLCALYDANVYRAGEVEIWNGTPLMLIPLGYDTMESQIEITIDKDGNFIGARTLEKSEAETIVPYPEGRTSGIKALPLFDTLSYIAGDLLDSVTLYFDSDTTEKQKQHKIADIKKCFPLYIAGLKAWCDSPFSHPKVSAICQYVLRRKVAGDLIKSRVLLTDEDGIVSDKKKIQGARIEKAFVRFRVYMDNMRPSDIFASTENAHDSAVWLDKTVQRNFIAYYLSTSIETDLCYLTGERTMVAKTNPVKIRGKWDTKAKLISANDDTNFSYRGRFNTKDDDTGYNEALSIGFETSQKIHNALKWIVRRQGFVRDGVCVVTWENALNDIPKYYDSAAGIMNKLSDDTDDIVLNEDTLFDEADDSFPVTNYASAAEFNAKLDGYASKLNDTSRMEVLALDSATPGRLAMTYYKELNSSRYLDNIRLWHESCCWKHEYIKDKKRNRYEGMASIRDVAIAIYGTEQGRDKRNQRIELRKNSDGRCPMLTSAFERLRPCIVDGAGIPRDMVRAAVIKASNPLAYEDQFNYYRVLHIACSLVKRLYWEKKQRNEEEGVVFKMELDRNITDRSYLYGRLLAVAEKVERGTYEKGETRITNAERYMQVFSRTPFRTWTIIWNNIQPYMRQLKPAGREYYKNLFGEITVLFQYDDRISNAALNGKYLIGYDCQRRALQEYRLKTKPDVEENKTDDTGMEE